MKLVKLLATAAAGLGVAACQPSYQQPPSGAMYPTGDGNYVMVQNPAGENMWCKRDIISRGQRVGNQIILDPSRSDVREKCSNYPPNNQGYDDPSRQMQRNSRFARTEINGWSRTIRQLTR